MRTIISSLIIFLSSSLPLHANVNVPSIENNEAKQKPIITIPAFSAQYTLLHKSDPVGSALRQLTYVENTNNKPDSKSAIYHYETDIEWLIFSDKRSETSTLTIDGNKVIPQHYVYKREGTGRDKSYEWRYDFVKKMATDEKSHRQVTLVEIDGLQDKLSYHLQNRVDLIEQANDKTAQKRFSYPVISTSGSIKSYVYEYDGEEELILPYGLVKTIRLKREITAKKRITYAWFAPELNYLLVKLYQVKAGAEQFEAQLSHLEILQ